MKNRQATRMFGMTVMGGITVNGPMFDIHDNQHLHFYNHDMKPEVKNQAPAEEAEEETWEMKELKFFDMKKFDTAEKQLKLSKALRVSAMKIDRSTGREWFGLYAAYRYARKETGTDGCYVDFFCDIESLIPDMLTIMNSEAKGDLRYRIYTKGLRKEVKDWYVDNKILPPINSLIYRSYHFGCNEDRFLKLKGIISELYIWLKENM